MSAVTTRQQRETWMRRAIEVATGAETPPTVGSPVTARNRPAPIADAADVPVGAVIVDPDGVEVAIGRNERELTADPTAHAEIVALRRAAARIGNWRMEGYTIVVTLEPCTMCAGALVLARMSTLVFGAWEPKTGAVGSLWDVVRDSRLNHRIEVYAGVLAAECGAPLRDFFGDRRAGDRRANVSPPWAAGARSLPSA